jgi:hypothetical protein
MRILLAISSQDLSFSLGNMQTLANYPQEATAEQELTS